MCKQGLKCFELVHFRPLPDVVKNKCVVEVVQCATRTAYSPPTEIIRKHYGNCANHLNFVR